jgi:hypothetical protein
MQQHRITWCSFRTTTTPPTRILYSVKRVIGATKCEHCVYSIMSKPIDIQLTPQQTQLVDINKRLAHFKAQITVVPQRPNDVFQYTVVTQNKLDANELHFRTSSPGGEQLSIAYANGPHTNYFLVLKHPGTSAVPIPVRVHVNVQPYTGDSTATKPSSFAPTPSSFGSPATTSPSMREPTQGDSSSSTVSGQQAIAMGLGLIIVGAVLIFMFQDKRSVGSSTSSLFGQLRNIDF